MKPEDTLLTPGERAQIRLNVNLADVVDETLLSQAKKTAELYQAEHQKQIEKLFEELENIFDYKWILNQRIYQKLKKKWLGNSNAKIQ